MMALADPAPLPPTWDAIGLGDLLARASARLDLTATMIANVEASLGILIHDARGLSPELIRDLQEIDLARQNICDIARVLRLAAAENCPTMISASALATVMQLREVAEQLLRPKQAGSTDPDPERDHISWF